MTNAALRANLEMLSRQPSPSRESALPALECLLDALESGSVRAAEPREGGWTVNRWVKQGILLGFKIGRNVGSQIDDLFHFRDRDTFPTWSPNHSSRNVRIVPGGTTVRRGVFLGEDVVVMPPAYVNVAAYVGRGSMVDSHALVGSCAQIGRNVHLSAAVQIGGVLEPVGASPTIVEDDVFVGGGCGIYEGTQVRSGAVLAPGVVLSRAVPVYDTVREQVYRAAGELPLIIPERAVIVPGSRPARGRFAEAERLQIQTPVIVKYRDARTAAALTLEEALR